MKRFTKVTMMMMSVLLCFQALFVSVYAVEEGSCMVYKQITVTSDMVPVEGEGDYLIGKQVTVPCSFDYFPSSAFVTGDYAKRDDPLQAVAMFHRYYDDYVEDELDFVNKFYEEYAHMQGTLAYAVIEQSIWYMHHGYAIYGSGTQSYPAYGILNCSEFTQRVFADFNFPISESTKNYESVGELVEGVYGTTMVYPNGKTYYTLNEEAKEILQLGDILVFAKDSTISHTAIFMGYLLDEELGLEAPAFIGTRNQSKHNPTALGIETDWRYSWGQNIHQVRRVLPEGSFTPGTLLPGHDQQWPVIPASYVLPPQMEVVMPTNLYSGSIEEPLQDEVDLNPAPEINVVETSFQDGMDSYEGTRDAYLRESSPTRNYGSATELQVDGEDSKGKDRLALLKWDLGSIPSGAEVLSVSLTVNVTNSSSYLYEIFALTHDWDEQSVTWNQAQSNMSWFTPGALSDRDSAILGHVNAKQLGSYTINFTAEGIAAVQQWVSSPEVNFGFMIENTDNTNGLDFSSREAVNVSERPVLTVQYTLQ